MNLPQQLQEYLNFPTLQIIDANTGLPEDESKFDALGQSALITFLAGLYKSTLTKEGAADIKSQINAWELLSAIFINAEDLIHTITSFSQKEISEVKEKMLAVSNGWLGFVKLKAPLIEMQNEDYLQNMMSTQRSEILKYLPGGLKLDELLNDPSLNDNTNQMQGPISSLMHKIENAFSTSG